MGKFIISDYVADLDTAATREMRLHPSYASGKDAEVDIKVVATVSCKVELFEGTSKQHDAGNVITAIACNRNSAEVSAIQACHTPSAGADGTSILSGIAAAGIPLEFEDIRLDRGEAYLLRITALSENNALNVSIEVEEDVVGGDETSESSSSSSCRSSSSSCLSSSSSSSSCLSSSSSSAAA